MVIKPQNPAYASLVHYYWAKYLEALLDRLADKVIAGEPPNRKEYEQMRWLYRRLKGAGDAEALAYAFSTKSDALPLLRHIFGADTGILAAMSGKGYWDGGGHCFAAASSVAQN